MRIVLIPLLLCLVVAVLVIALVVIPARKQGREVLTTRGGEALERVQPATDAVFAEAVVADAGARTGPARVPDVPPGA